MNYQVLNDFSKKASKKSNNELMAEYSMTPNKVIRVKNILGKGIAERCGIILANIEDNKKLTSNIEEYIKELKIYGFDIVSLIDKAEPSEKSIKNEKKY